MDVDTTGSYRYLQINRISYSVYFYYIYADGDFIEDNPIEVLVWSQDKDYPAVSARIQMIKKRARGEEEYSLAEEEIQQLERNLRREQVMGGR